MRKIILSTVLLGLLAGCTSINVVSQQEVQSKGKEAMANLLGAAPLLRDAELQRYVNQVGMWVAMQSEQPHLKWQFGVTDDKDINSYAAPPGYVLITKGLFDRLNTEAELAAVLGHEITHVIKGHHQKAMNAAKQREMGMGLAKFALAQTGKSESSQQALQGVMGGLTENYVRGLDKDDEYEADVNGMVLAARAGYNPYALVSVLQTIGGISPKDGAVALLFATHPSMNDRLESIEKNVGDKLERYAGGVDQTSRFARFK